MGNPKGDVLLVADSIVTDEAISGVKYAFRVCTPFESMLLAAKSAEDREAWKGMIATAIEISQYSLRGYMLKRTKGLMGTTKRKFFVLHQEVLTYHEDHEHTATTQFSMKINADTRLEVKDDKMKLFLYETSKAVDPTIIIQFEQRNKGDYVVWKEVISSNIKRFQDAIKEGREAVKKALDSAILMGILAHRPPKGGDTWPLFQTALTDREFLVLDSASSSSQMKIQERCAFNPDSFVRETKLKEFSFEVVTSKKIIHVNASSKQEMENWITEVRKVIEKVEIDRSDALLRAAIEKIALDVFYEVTFEEYRPLGIVLEKASEWAMVKKSNYAETGVKIGSALTSINGEIIMFNKYDTVMHTLKGWLTGALQPPLTLTFRLAPEKVGFLMKKSTVANITTWKARYCILGEGKFVLKESDEADAKTRGEIPLLGAAVSLMSTAETGKFYCFRVLVGVYELIMQAADLKDMIDWAATIYHAIAVANGGGHILQYELGRIKAEQERHRQMQEALNAQRMDEENRFVVEMISHAIEYEDIDELQRALQLAEQYGLVGELIDFATARLRELLESREALASNEIGIESEMMSPENAALEDDSAAFDAMEASINGDADPEDEDEDEHQATVSIEQMKRKSMSRRKMDERNVQQVGSAAAHQAARVTSGIIANEEDDIDDLLMMSEGFNHGAYLGSGNAEGMVEESALFNLDPASEEDVRKLFQFYAKDDGGSSSYINVMQFSMIWRLVTGEKGNLYKEMQMFNRFDTSNQGSMGEADFVRGWIELAIEMQTDEMLRRIKMVVGEDNLVL